MKQISTLRELEFDLEQESYERFRSLTLTILSLSSAGLAFMLAFDHQFCTVTSRLNILITLAWVTWALSLASGLILQHKFVINPLLRLRHARDIALANAEVASKTPSLAFRLPTPNTTLDNILYWTQLGTFVTAFLMLILFKIIN